MEQIIHLEYNHVSNFDLNTLLAYTDIWCEKIIDENRKKESLLARLLINKICSENSNKTLNDCGFQKDSKGKPFLKYCPDIHISISHCEGHVWVAAADCPLGIDFEEVNFNAKEDLKIAFNKEDWEQIKTNTVSVFKYFSLKESYTKMLGMGFLMEPSEIAIKDVYNNSYHKIFNICDRCFIFTIVTKEYLPENLLLLLETIDPIYV
jgi:phosphopantetheinyl transferase